MPKLTSVTAIITSNDVFLFSEAISFERARVLLPDTNGKAPSVATIKKWATAGAKSTGGKCVVLKSTKIDDVEFTRAEWIQEFIRDCSSGVDPPIRWASTLTPVRRRLIARGLHGAKARDALLGPKNGRTRRNRPPRMPQELRGVDAATFDILADCGLVTRLGEFQYANHPRKALNAC